jgi:hypothetical protein
MLLPICQMSHSLVNGFVSLPWNIITRTQTALTREADRVTCLSETGERGEGNKRKRESCWKSGGGRVRLYTWRRAGLADEVGSDAIPDTAGGEVVTGPLNRMA